MKFKLIILFGLTVVCLDLFSQCRIKQIDISGNSKDINIDSVLNIPRHIFDSINLSQITFPPNIESDSKCPQCTGTVYANFVLHNKKLIETTISRGVAPEFDSILLEQHKVVLNNLEKYSNFDNDKFYFVSIGVRYEYTDVDDKKYIDKCCCGFDGRNYILQKSKNDIHFIADSISPNDIPNNINECLMQLDSVLDSLTKNRIKIWNEESCSNKTGFEFRKWMWKNWHLTCGLSVPPDIHKNNLLKYFYDLGLKETCYIPSIVSSCYLRYLKGERIRFEEELEKYKQIEKNNPVVSE